MTIEVLPFGGGVGAEVRGVDTRKPVTPDLRARLLDAWHQNLVLMLHGAPLAVDELIAFSRNFGELELAPLSEIDRFEGVPREITIVSNIVKDGRPIGTLGNAEASWHTDSSCDELPPAGSLLHALEVPPQGGNTHFCNMYVAYETLPQDLKERIDGRYALHDASYTSAGTLRKGREVVTDVTRVPGARHPLVRTHPATGRKALFLGRRLNSYIVGLPVEESETLLDRLWAHVQTSAPTWQHAWQPGDIVIWDNRCTMHRRDSFDSAARRLLHRTQLRGDRPV